jgi:hypothetical protein
VPIRQRPWAGNQVPWPGAWFLWATDPISREGVSIPSPMSRGKVSTESLRERRLFLVLRAIIVNSGFCDDVCPAGNRCRDREIPPSDATPQLKNNSHRIREVQILGEDTRLESLEDCTLVSSRQSDGGFTGSPRSSSFPLMDDGPNLAPVRNQSTHSELKRCRPTHSHSSHAVLPRPLDSIFCLVLDVCSV